MKRHYLFLLILISSSFLHAQHSEFILPAILSDHAVLQRNAEVKLWGWCPSVWDLKIVCSWAPTDTIRTMADKDCAWSAYVHTPETKGPHSIRFIGWEGKQVGEINDVLLGENWLCSGQSNMEYNFNWRVSDAGDLDNLVNNSDIRLFKIDKGFSPYPVDKITGKWEICNSDSYKDFSVVGFFFGQRINRELGVPVGLIGSYWGGTAVQPWTPAASYELEPKLLEKANRLPASWAPTANSSIYNAMIHPITPFTLAGVIWYQGEANNEQAEDYGDLFEAMIRGWRDAFHRFLPFYFVQIAPWDGYADKNGAIVREQQNDVLRLANTGMVVINDLVPDVKDIHPSEKRTVGERLANIALREHFGKTTIEACSPVFEAMRLEKGKVYIKTSAQGRLESPVSSIRNFELVDKAGMVYPAKAKLLRNGEICIWNDTLRDPVNVRYCFTNDAVAELFDINGLPLAPFRTDRQ